MKYRKILGSSIEVFRADGLRDFGRNTTGTRMLLKKKTQQDYEENVSLCVSVYFKF